MYCKVIKTISVYHSAYMTFSYSYSYCLHFHMLIDISSTSRIFPDFKWETTMNICARLLMVKCIFNIPTSGWQNQLPLAVILQLPSQNFQGSGSSGTWLQQPTPACCRVIGWSWLETTKTINSGKTLSDSSLAHPHSKDNYLPSCSRESPIRQRGAQCSDPLDR